MGVRLIACLPGIAGADDFNAAAERYGWPMLCDPTCAFKYPGHHELLSLWRGLAGSDDIPYRRQMTARLLQPHLRSIALYECVDGADGARRYRVRLMGSQLVQMMGEMTGKFLDEAIPEKFLPRWHAARDAAPEGGVPLRILIRSDTLDKAHMVAEYFCAPLRADDGAARLILFAGHYDGARAWTEVDTEERARLGLEPSSQGRSGRKAPAEGRGVNN